MSSKKNREWEPTLTATAHPPIEVLPYSINQLVGLLCAAAPHSEREKIKIKNKPHVEYFKEYFGHFERDRPLTIIVERSYTDRDFLEDYAAYYARCFEGRYKSTCTRLHFFQIKIDKAELDKAVLGESEILNKDSLNEAYLGFIVVKPLPFRCIGRTCLRTYEDDDNRRQYPVIRSYEVHLLGFDLKVKSIALQEQDTVAAACATSALWSIFQATAKLFQHPIYSPFEITRVATNHFPSMKRVFPNKGLNTLQISAAIRHIGLEPENIGVETKAWLQSAAYGYLRAGIPIVLMARMYDVSEAGKWTPYNDDPGAGHAVAIMGYSLGKSSAVRFSDDVPIRLRSSQIDKLYVHDDGIGPFARMPFANRELKQHTKDGTEKTKILQCFDSSWPCSPERRGRVCFVPETLIVPLYHKIRINLEDVLTNKQFGVFAWNQELPSVLEAKGVTLTSAEPLEWDVYLQRNSCFKQELRTKGVRRGADQAQMLDVLQHSLPRFIWRASAFSGESLVADFIYDATDIADGSYLREILFYEAESGD